MSRNGRLRRQTLRRRSTVGHVSAEHSVRKRVAATMKRYARLDDQDQPVRCVGFRQGSKIVFDTAERAESCRRSLVDRGLSETRAVHECRRREGEIHFHLTRRESHPERD